MLDILALAAQCAPTVHPKTIELVVRAESSGNPYAIGVVGGRLERQPRTLNEALAATRILDAAGRDYSVGLGQVNKRNWMKYGLATTSAFDGCQNLRAAGAILQECFGRASLQRVHQQRALRDALSCYYSGNFRTGYEHGYVARVTGDAGPTQARRTGQGGQAAADQHSASGEATALLF